MEKSKDIKIIIANNIIKQRKQLGLTQLELAEKLNYSDKTLSKWERAEAVPDIITLAQLAELFNTTVDSLISDDEIEIIEPIKPKKGITRKKTISIVLLSLSIVWLVATFAFVFLRILPIDVNTEYFKPWVVFIYAIPVSAILLIVFSSIWGNSIDVFVSVSILIWTLALALTISFSHIEGINLLYILAIPLEIMSFIYFCIYKRKNRV